MSNKVTNPYAPGTGHSILFRIPALYTLKSGRILACSDIRYGNGTDDPANVDVAIRYSDDNGKSWSNVQFVNHFEDMVDCDHNVAIPTSASFVDSAIVECEDNEIYHMCDACPAYMGLWSAGTYGKGNGYIDGKLVLSDLVDPLKAASTRLDKEHYPYYIDDFNDEGYAPVLKFSDNTSYDGYYVDKAYNIYKNGLLDIIGFGCAGVLLVVLCVYAGRFEWKLLNPFKEIGIYTYWIMCIHSVELICFPWDKIVKSMPDYPAVAFAIELGLKFILIAGICIVLKKITLYRYRKMRLRKS